MEIRELSTSEEIPEETFSKGPEYRQYKTKANRLQKRISKDITIRKRDSWKIYCHDMELSEGQGTAWCKIRSVLNPKSAPCNFPTLVPRAEGGIKTRSVTTTKKLETFASQLEGVFTNEIENNVFDEEVKTDVDSRIRPAHCQSKTKLHQLSHHQKNIRYLIPTLLIIFQDLLNICVFHGYHPIAWKRAWALMAHKPSKRRSDPCSYMPISLLCCLSKVSEAIMTKRLTSWAENTDKLPTEQSGFKKHHTTNDKIFEPTQAVCQAQRLSRRVGAIFLDFQISRHSTESGAMAYVTNCYT